MIIVASEIGCGTHDQLLLQLLINQNWWCQDVLKTTSAGEVGVLLTRLNVLENVSVIIFLLSWQMLSLRETVILLVTWKEVFEWCMLLNHCITSLVLFSDASVTMIDREEWLRVILGHRNVTCLEVSVSSWLLFNTKWFFFLFGWEVVWCKPLLCGHVHHINDNDWLKVIG